MTCRLAAFPKCFLDALFPARTMTWFDWIELAATLPQVEGLEIWPPALESYDPAYLGRIRSASQAHGLETPMMCASPDFTQGDPERRAAEIAEQRTRITAVSELGGTTCRVLSGQRRPDVSRQDGIDWTVDAIQTLLPHAQRCGVILVMENHYKDGLWQYPEFAQGSDVFLEIIEQIDSPWFGINYDPSNALIAGDDPIALLQKVKERVVSMHASDRALESGTVEDLRRMDLDPTAGYSPLVVCHASSSL